MKKRKAKTIWGLMIPVLIILAYVLPYTVLSETQAWYGSFLIWGMIGVIIIIANLFVTKDWGK
ncbi:hypothetical protein ACFO3D_10375 [Virgibacillus kekensis]|uniref:Uncharacterized protein n=1 Tax=Virgibacillus kekensis TaxID=202261 RepID=A0ABV9DM25_9BACI